MRQSDRVFFQALYEQYKYLLLRVAGGFVTDPQEAEDLVQTALTRLLPKVDTLRQLEEKALCTYLCYTVRNAALNQLRKDGLRQKILVRQDSTELQADPAPGPEELLLQQERTDRFRSVLEALPHEERTLLLDKYLLGRSNEALAKELGCKPESIRMKLTRIRRKVLALMEEGEEHA